MTILDRYIARQYLLNVGTLFVLLCCFVVAVDVSLNLDRFLRVAAQMSRAQAADGTVSDSSLRRALITLFIIGDLWWPRLVQLFVFMLGLVLVGAMGFTCTQLARHRELVAMLAGGVSLHRAARPILLVALLLTGVKAGTQEFVLPRIAPLLPRDHGDAGARRLGESRVELARDGAGRLWYAAAFDADLGTLSNVSIWERDATGLASRVIRADAAAWRRGAWELENPRVERRADPGADLTPPRRIETDLDPAALKMRRYAGFRHALSFSQIARVLARPEGLDPRRRDDLAREFWGRISTMAANLLALVIALPFFLTREPRNPVLQSLKCAPVAILSLVGAVFGATAVVPDVPPEVSAFIPVLVLLPIAVAMGTSVRS